jgi:hypothetical protein
MLSVEERSLNDLGTKQLDKHELLPAKSLIQIRLSEFINIENQADICPRYSFK